MCKRSIGVPQELGRILLYAPRQFPAGDTGLSTPGSDSALVWQRAKTTSATRYRQAKETKCGEMAVGCRSTRIVLMKPRNWSRRTRWREGKTERGCLMLDPRPRNTSEASYSESRITFTTQDSNPGMQYFAARRIQRQRNRMR